LQSDIILLVVVV